jgi:hypothetical protein
MYLTGGLVGTNAQVGWLPEIGVMCFSHYVLSNSPSTKMTVLIITHPSSPDQTLSGAPAAPAVTRRARVWAHTSMCLLYVRGCVIV